MSLFARESSIKAACCTFLLIFQLPLAAFGPWGQDAYVPYKNPKNSRTKPTEALRVSLEASITFFQKTLSPQDGPVCRFRPSCSTFGKRAVRKNGVLEGLLQTADRLMRDHPWAERELDLP